jgi:hypothetical protein
MDTGLSCYYCKAPFTPAYDLHVVAATETISRPVAEVVIAQSVSARSVFMFKTSDAFQIARSHGMVLPGRTTSCA